MSEMPNPPQYSWNRRRRLMYLVVVFCMAVVAYILLRGLSGSVAETSVTMAFGTIVSVTGSYVFGATWQDITSIKKQ